jgi:hypothetical protein
MRYVAGIPNSSGLMENITCVRVELVSYWMSYIILRLRWCDVILLHVHAPIQVKLMILWRIAKTL